MSKQWEERFHVALACFVGSFFGGAIAREIAASFELGAYFIWLGVVYGAVIGWSTYRLGTVWSAVKQVAKKMIMWRPDYKFWRYVWHDFLQIQNAVLSVAIFICSLFWIWALIKGIPKENIFGAWFALFFIAFIIEGIILTDRFESYSVVTYEPLNLNPKRYNPFTIHFHVVYWFGWSILTIIKYIYRWVKEDMFKQITTVSKFGCTFLWRVFVLIHSRERTICAVDSAVGSIIAYSFGYGLAGLLVGATAGALLGLVNYELVSVRWLKLLPAESKSH
jgi:hypothetical protein